MAPVDRDCWAPFWPSIGSQTLIHRSTTTLGSLGDTQTFECQEQAVGIKHEYCDACDPSLHSIFLTLTASVPPIQVKG